jgi:hypothetical protein
VIRSTEIFYRAAAVAAVVLLGCAVVIASPSSLAPSYKVGY